MIPDGRLQDLYATARQRRREAHRPSTRRNLGSCQRLYLQFCVVYGIDIYRPSVDDLASFAEWLIQAGLAPATIKNYLSTIRGLYLLWDIRPAIEVLESYAWSLTLRAIPFASRTVTSNRSTLSPEQLLALVRVCSVEHLWPLKVALIFGFMGYLRVSNLAPSSLSEFDHTRHTTWGDITESKGGIMLKLKWTKTRQTETEAAPIPLPALKDSELCPSDDLVRL